MFPATARTAERVVRRKRGSSALIGYRFNNEDLLTEVHLEGTGFIFVEGVPLLAPERIGDAQLKRIMTNIHSTCLAFSEEYHVPGNYVVGANIAGFVKVAEAMIDQGVV